MSGLAIAKIFMNGRSQAVRLPKEFRFDTDEVTVERQEDGAVLLRPRRATQGEWWAALEDLLGRFEGMPDEIERDKTPPRDVPGWD
ncbi:MAG TPA: AbrB/MazE/SpoVT family DNA-binding domain-containing protein [Alicycliphilus sp.]|nr:AbrB/MazE/SpoVT family DNA-binding domain-containing protein [Alicycliphilus sp.]HRP20284.1 AbrB/MazE/SpoVT family DNA-binding domain-containing protein [Alicycliphilus sp.]